MLGKLLAKIRKEKKMTMVELGESLNVSASYFSYIERGERTPSSKVLKSICDVLDIPYQPIMYTYDKKINSEQESYGIENHIKYDSIPMLNNISGFAKCSEKYRSASICLRVNDDTMSPKFNLGSYVYVEFNSPLINRDYGIFEYNGQYLLRKFIIRQKDLVLRAEQDGIDDIVLNKDDTFFIIGKVLGSTD